ncbi:MAG: ATP-binding protein [Methanothrix sp.]|nr:ATP-binding protein [Methanothrix sp.]
MKISIASGKGGTGKTLVATSLVASLASPGTMVTIADCDVEEPNAFLFFPERTILERKECPVPVPVIDEALCTHCGKCSEVCAYHALAVLPETVLLFPELCHGCGACKIICPEGAVSETSRSVGEIFRAQSGGVEIVWGELALGEARTTPLIKAVKTGAGGEMVIVDCPPGTSCSLVESVCGTDFCLLVTEPTPFGLYDLNIALKVLEKMNIPHGVLVNKSGMGDRRVYEYLEKRNIPLLMEIPLDRKIAELYSRGEIFAEKMPQWKAQFVGMVRRIEEMIS